MRGPAGMSVGTIRRLIIGGITCMQAEASPKIGCIVAGIPGHSIEDLKISDMILVHPGGGAKSNADAQVPEKEKNYPEPNMFGTTPAHGFFMRHVKGLEVHAIKIQHAAADARPAFLLEDAENTEFGRIKAATDAGVPTFLLRDVKNFNLYRSRPVPDAEIAAAELKEI